MSRDALLNYATPPRHPIAPRADWLAVFSFGWTFAVAPPVMLLFYVTAEEGAAAGLFSPLGFVALVATPAVAVLSGYFATERGAPWDSPYRATGFAVFAVPTAWLMMAAGALVYFRMV